MAYRPQQRRAVRQVLQRRADHDGADHPQRGSCGTRTDRRALGFYSGVVETAEAAGALLQRDLRAGGDQNDVARSVPQRPLPDTGPRLVRVASAGKTPTALLPVPPCGAPDRLCPPRVSVDAAAATTHL